MVDKADNKNKKEMNPHIIVRRELSEMDFLSEEEKLEILVVLEFATLPEKLHLKSLSATRLKEEFEEWKQKTETMQ